MELSEDFILRLLALTEEYRGTSPDRILLGKGALTSLERTALARQLGHKKALAKKLPSWYTAGVFLPSTLALEQCSGERAASYKARFVSPADTVLDLTGGFGVDFWALASVAQAAVYCERQADLVVAARHNLPRLLPAKPLTLLEGVSTDQLPRLIADYTPSLIFVDPARREGTDKHRRVYAIEDCEPNLHTLLPDLHQIYQQLGHPFPRLLVKLSPMLDPVHTLRHVAGVEELHLVAVRGEVKDLLLLIDVARALEPPTPEVVPFAVVDLAGEGEAEALTFPEALATEANLTADYAEELGGYLFEPHAALMKTGLFRSIAHRFGLQPLHPNTHLYTTTQPPTGALPGRTFRIDAVYPFAAGALKGLRRELPPAQITCRNFPLTPEALRQKLRLSESSATTLFGTTLLGDRPVLLCCSRLG